LNLLDAQVLAADAVASAQGLALSRGIDDEAVIIVVVCGAAPGDPLFVASNVQPESRPAVAENLKAAARAVLGM
jgi:hypothetical protein